jgi:hypothetical protein
VRDTDKVKIVPFDEGNIDEEAHSGDMALLNAQPSVVYSVTFSPIKDSLHSVELSEGGDELSEEEIMERFVVPYLNQETDEEVLLKEGHTLVLMDANKVSLEFTVSHLDLEGEEVGDDGAAEVETKGKYRASRS